MRLMLAVDQWRTAERHVMALEGRESLRAEEIVGAVGDELRRRLGGAFTAGELVDLYDAGTSWTLDLAARLAPSDPDLWSATVTDAAFWRYLGHAQDWGGGRLIVPDE
ncbi:hypothetical protein [Patulibacter sp. SYSU D01012]|uniref:hypothetical protein n=1 Tax=Patulibacter sp. SYSU D01012 TaxID=2817381 RepID=UPI001B30BDB2|nr:hypothetical protein [Patulibacter sp. SYSU D01012]